MERTDDSSIGLAEAALRLCIPYQNAHRLLLTGRLRGRKQGGRWLVTEESLEEAEDTRDEWSST